MKYLTYISGRAKIEKGKSIGVHILNSVLQLRFEKGRVLIQKRAFLACSNMLRGLC